MTQPDTSMSTEARAFFAIEDELQRRRDQSESVKGKKPGFRVEFRFRGGSKAWEYFCTYDDALNAPDHKKCRYSIYGNAIIERPSSRQIQVRGPRGGWSRYKP